MKKIFILPFALYLSAQVALAQISEERPVRSADLAPIEWANTASREFGDIVYSLDLEFLSGDIRTLGAEFDGIHFWATGLWDFTLPYLYEISQDGELLNRYPQPPGNWGSWGWRDLCWDGEYLYAGDDVNKAYHITQIDPSDGQPTGTYYGPYPINPCRALAYDEKEDCFWTASFSSSLYQCFKDGTSNTFTNPGLSIYSAAIESSHPDHPMLWWLSMDGYGGLASEFSLVFKSFTGKTFELDPWFGNIPSGAGAYDIGHNAWVLIVLLQANHVIEAYDLGTAPIPLFVDPLSINAWVGGTAHFTLSASEVHAGRGYGLFGTLSGIFPGTLLPGGATTLPINWDWFTTMLIGYNSSFTFGTLDSFGSAKESLVVPGQLNISEDLTLSFAYCLAGPPWDYASNWIKILLKK
ncbi:MAG: hypothetical protein ACYTG7_08475 [Planctomycetota bacterium]|jgi:hypothetical protein